MHLQGIWKNDPEATARKKSLNTKFLREIENADFDITTSWEWIWIDTCCIDQQSSSEEVVNSMYRWYSKAQVCHAYLEECLRNYSWKVQWLTRGKERAQRTAIGLFVGVAGSRVDGLSRTS